ncbi:MAG: hypothetical protein ACYTEV_12555 [Planctomycetota bacterium]|jgi:hypothetical protein
MSVDGTVICPHCGETSQVARKYAGRRARCHRCSTNFTITFAGPDEVAAAEAAAATTSAAAPNRTGGRSRGRAAWIIATAFVVIVGGVIAGIALTGPDAGPPEASAADPATSVMESEVRESTTPAAVSPPPAPPAATGTVIPDAPPAAPVRLSTGLDALGLTPFGESIQRGRLSLRVAAARITRPELRTTNGSIRTADDPALLITVELTSIDAGAGIGLQPSHDGLLATLEDDFGNLLRSPPLPPGTRLADALPPDAAITAGEPIAADVAFETPPPLSDHLVLTLDLAPFGESGRVRFRIPRSRIAG